MKTVSLRICKDCGVEVTGKYRRLRCETCYRRTLRREKGITPRLKAPQQRVWQGASPDLFIKVFGNTTPGQGGCIIYTGRERSNGYGAVSLGGRRQGSAHRVAFEVLVGPIPDDLTVDHVCHNESTTCPGGPSCIHRRCVNPRHLEAVASAENTRRAAARPNSRMGRRGWASKDCDRKGSCRKGHEMTPENTTWEKRSSTSDERHPRCRQCLRDYQSAYRERRRKTA